METDRAVGGESSECSGRDRRDASFPRGGKLLSAEETIHFASTRDVAREQLLKRIVSGMQSGVVLNRCKLVEKLRSYSKVNGYTKLMNHAADEIERLAKRVAELEAEREAR